MNAERRNDNISVSIIICTYNRAIFLDYLLRLLIPQIKVAEVLEILVIDNNSKDNSQEIFKFHSESETKIKYFFEPQQGLSYARNRGIREAKGDWLAYIDDDAYPSENWVERIIFNIRLAKHDAFGGVYLPWYKDGKKDWFLDSYASNKPTICHKAPVTLKSKTFSGGNCAYSKTLLQTVGGFPTNIGMNGNQVSYGEEDRVQLRARNLNFKLGFDSNLIIHHYVSPKKQTIDWLILQAVSKGRDYWARTEANPSWAKLALFLLALPFGLSKTLSISVIRQLKGETKWIHLKIAFIQKYSFLWSRIKTGVTIKR